MVQIKLNNDDSITKKRKKVSKRNKKSWRKHVDVQDIDNFLEDKRLEERLGKPFAKRLDAELFAVDTEPDNENFQKAVKDSKAEYRLALKKSQPRCFAVLKSNSAVPDPIAKRNRVKTREERKNPITKRIEAMRKINGQLKLKKKLAIENQKLAEEKRSNKPRRGDYNLNVWEIKPQELEEIDAKIDSQWLTSDTLRHTLANKGLRKRKIPNSLHKKPSILPAVEPPHPGMSYNPSYEDHQRLLTEVAEKEMKLMKEQSHLHRVTTKMFKKVSAAESNENWLKESSEGLPSSDAKNNVEKEDSEDEMNNRDSLSVNPPVVRKKKTLVQRRKLKEHRQSKSARNQEKLQKKKSSDIYKLRLLNKKIENKEREMTQLQAKKEKLKTMNAAKTKVLSKTKFEKPDLDFQMGNELSGNLRNTQPVKNLLTDRYKSLQQRNIVAPSTRKLKLNRAKVKKYIKPDHKIKLPKDLK